jgi:primosomal protein N'
MHSFCWRIALSSALISGLVVLAFGAVAWWSLSRACIADLDAEMRHFGYRVMLRSDRNVDLSSFLAAWKERVKLPSAVRMTLDVEPYSFM